MRKPLLATILLLLCRSALSQTSAPYRYDMPLDELVELKIRSAATLAPIERRLLPANTTLIDAAMIRASGARDLIDLLSLYVPGFQVDRHTSRLRIWGTRGVNSPVKYTLLVNGRNTVDDWVAGVLPELLLGALDDIESVEYVNGPGSVLFGGGAVGGVISITTRAPSTTLEDGASEAGALGATRGVVDQRSMVEARYTRRLAPELALGLYYAAERYVGLADDDTDFHTTVALPGIPVGGRWPAAMSPFGRNDPYATPTRHKLMLQLDGGEWKSWLRWVEAGAGTIYIAGQVTASRYPHAGFEYSQLSWHNEWQHALADDLSIKLEMGLQHTRSAQRIEGLVVRQANDYGGSSVRIDEQLSRATLIKNFASDHYLALGSELIWNSYRSFNPAIPTISDRSLAVFGEYRRPLLPTLALIAGVRLDQNRWTERSIAPRYALVWEASAHDTVKLMQTKGFRDIQAEAWWSTASKRRARDEYTVSRELIYSRQFNDALRLTLGTYRVKAEAIGAVPDGYRVVGLSDSRGASALLEWARDGWRLGLSHNYDDVLSQQLPPDVSGNNFISSYPGEAPRYWNWSPHSSKLYGMLELNSRWSLGANLQINWHYDGLQQQYRHLNFDKTGFAADFGPQVNLNLNASWRPAVRHTVSLNAYNLVALFDRDRNRTHTYVAQDYSTMPFMAAVSYQYAF